MIVKHFTISFTNGATHNGVGGDTHPTSSTTFGAGGTLLWGIRGVPTVGTTSGGTTSEGETTPPSEGRLN